jgi:hypothetical protein
MITMSHSRTEYVTTARTQSKFDWVEKRQNPMRNDRHSTLRASAAFTLQTSHAHSTQVDVELRYTTKDPHAVVAAFRTGRAGWVEWVFARTVLADGLLTHAGEGDIRIQPAKDNPARIVIELTSPSGHAAFEASIQDLSTFLDQTYDMVLPGDEHLWMDIDEQLAFLLSDDYA